MILSQDRDQLRNAYVQAWKKTRADQPLDPLEQQLVRVISEHPEYHALLEDEETALHRDFSPEAGEVNPFLHMGLHIAVREQLATERPAGIRKAFRNLQRRGVNPHEAEHRVMECLSRAMWDIQHNGRPFDDTVYLKCIRNMARGR